MSLTPGDSVFTFEMNRPNILKIIFLSTLDRFAGGVETDIAELCCLLNNQWILSEKW